MDQPGRQRHLYGWRRKGGTVHQGFRDAWLTKYAPIKLAWHLRAERGLNKNCCFGHQGHGPATFQQSFSSFLPCWYNDQQYQDKPQEMPGSRYHIHAFGNQGQIADKYAEIHKGQAPKAWGYKRSHRPGHQRPHNCIKCASTLFVFPVVPIWLYKSIPSLNILLIEDGWLVS